MLSDKILKFLKLDGLIESLTGYVETRVELLKVEVKEEIVTLLIKALLFLIIAFSCLFFLLFISLSLAFWIGNTMGMTASFSIVAGIYFLVMILLFLFKDSIREKLKKKFLEEVKTKK